MKKSPQYNVLILHLDLGIGGAEQLIVTMAKCIQDLGHKVEILTSHHNVNHCFEETKPNGVLGKSISVYGDWLPRNFMNKFTAFFAILRMLLLAFIAIFFRRNIDLVILDGISAPIPLLKFAGFRVLFYCHFPDLVKDVFSLAALIPYFTLHFLVIMH
jgi:alpha-1,3/alpha-1,6-mannosyltransferase